MFNARAIRTFLLAGAASLPLAVSGSAQTPPVQPPPTQARSPASAGGEQDYRYRLLGVYDETTGQPIEGVDVADLLSGVHSPTSRTGTVSLFFVPDGGSLIRLRKLGYEAQTFPVAISPTDTTPITVTLRAAPQQLAAMRITDSMPKYSSARLRSAEARLRSHAGGYFIDETAMRKLDNSTMTSALIAKAAGLMSVLGPHGESYFISTRHPCVSPLVGCVKPNCFINVYVDGIRSTIRPDFNRLWPGDYAIAEFYPGEASTPAEFGGELLNPCGVLLLWSRER
jgi:hypothetical protein